MTVEGSEPRNHGNRAPYAPELAHACGVDADDLEDDVVARTILRVHHLLPDPTAEQLGFAIELVGVDAEASRALAFGGTPPVGREDVLTAPALGVYLPKLRSVEATPAAIRTLVANEYNLSVGALISLELVAAHTWPRQVGIYLARARTDAADETIAATFGRRRVSTVAASCRAVREQVRISEAAANALARLDAAICRPSVGPARGDPAPARPRLVVVDAKLDRDA
jgi:hypothetical protein